MKRQTGGYLLLFLGIGVGSQFSMANDLVANTPSKEVEYEASHQGTLRVQVSLFSAPCNLAKPKGMAVQLTGCGVGPVFRGRHLTAGSAYTPARLRLIDVKQKHAFMPYSQRLLPGENAVQVPQIQVGHNPSLRLEVNYE
ncbi:MULTISPECIES: hypothetical protein [Proteus]|uniref:Fimbrial protein n=1 Tax=Proteus penneri TaxID=102862 RepID=A0ABS0VZG0_9GAMM|nr:MULTISPECIES: hypothetical protein [Proteus]EEG83314.1 hypothetical protein PROPEN_04078 [Proteus penneri ATCC 35198]MBJ2116432.1 fimbrial protein [Proteus penneri]NBM67792.1 fimbrial protein [Proteus sp. G2663]NBN03795.1 fimbrial protein [Proteus sp. G2665]SUC00706.1 fimbrial protein [Proteus penneri]